jgi:hypothetical protein
LLTYPKLSSFLARETMQLLLYKYCLPVLVLLLGVHPAHGQKRCAHVVDATATQNAKDGTWTIWATVSSTETGINKYADEWRVEDPDGNILGTKVLLHPHVDEQPFTRSLPGVEIPANISVVTIAAQDSVLGYCGDTFELSIASETVPASVAPADVDNNDTELGEEGCAHVVNATATQNAKDDTWTIWATVSSTETGFDKYADEWRVEDSDGNILGTKVLSSHHKNEQPFTRSLPGVTIPDDVSVLTIAAQDSVMGYCGDTFELIIPANTAQTDSWGFFDTTKANSSNLSNMVTLEKRAAQQP